MQSVNPIYVLVGVVSLAAVCLLAINLYFMVKSRRNNGQDVAQYTVLHQRLDSFANLISQQFDQNRQSSEKVVTYINDQLEKNRQSTERATLSVNQQVQGFTQNITQLQEGLKQMHETVKDVSSFQEIFKSPKLRGNWGEMSLNACLEQYFPKDLYAIQHSFKSGEIVDAALKLPNNFLLPIDSKFNWENFEKMANADNEIHKDGFRKLFYGDVKKKVDEIATKYIIPAEGTTDFALMFIPAETVYYEMINHLKDVDIPEYARKKKVMLVSPNTFFLSVSAIHHWYRDIQVSQKTQEIIKKLQTVAADGNKLADNFRKLGSHISNAKSAYDDSEKRLSLMVGRVQKVVGLSDGSPDKEELEGPSA